MTCSLPHVKQVLMYVATENNNNDVIVDYVPDVCQTSRSMSALHFFQL